MQGGTLALIPARGGSKGIPRKNLASLGGLSLLGHAIRSAQAADDVERIVVSTDDAEIAAAAVELGAGVPFERPADLAADDAPSWPVVQHVLRELATAGDTYERVLLLQPTSPFRTATEISAAHRLLGSEPSADGVIGASPTSANPLALAVTSDEHGWLRHAAPAARSERRQDAGEVLLINGALYLWRSDFVLAHDSPANARTLLLTMSRQAGVDIDDPWDLAVAQAILAAGLVRLPWLETG